MKSLLPSEPPPHPVPLPLWGEGIKKGAPLPGTLWVWERARVRVSQVFVNNPG
jgi:hypothetical protein